MTATIVMMRAAQEEKKSESFQIVCPRYSEAQGVWLSFVFVPNHMTVKALELARHPWSTISLLKRNWELELSVSPSYAFYGLVFWFCFVLMFWFVLAVPFPWTADCKTQQFSAKKRWVQQQSEKNFCICIVVINQFHWCKQVHSSVRLFLNRLVVHQPTFCTFLVSTEPNKKFPCFNLLSQTPCVILVEPWQVLSHLLIACIAADRRATVRTTNFLELCSIQKRKWTKSSLVADWNWSKCALAWKQLPGKELCL